MSSYFCKKNCYGIILVSLKKSFEGNRLLPHRRDCGRVDLHPGRVEQRPDDVLRPRVGAHVERGQLCLRRQVGRDGVRGGGGQL